MNNALYAWVEDGIVSNVTEWDGNTDPEAGGLVIPDGVTMALVPSGQVAYIGYPATKSESGVWSFEIPPAPIRSPEEIVASNAATRNRLLEAAGLAIAPLQDAADLGIITAEEQTLLVQWKSFRVAVNRIDVSAISPVWPDAPQGGYGAVLVPSDSES